jgi:hypothetical protein
MLQQKISIWRPTTPAEPLLEDVSATSAGLKQIYDSRFAPGWINVTISCDGLTDEAKVNFIALWQKSLKHIRFILGLPVNLTVQRSQIWRKYFRNTVDTEHGEGRNFEDFLMSYLQTYLTNIVYDGHTFKISGQFSSPQSVAAAVGRFVNMMRWSEQWTQSIKLVSEAELTWATFNRLSVEGEQPIVRRRK